MQYVIVSAAWLWGLWALVELTDAGTDLFVSPLLMFSGGVIGVAWVSYGATVFVARKRQSHRLFWSVPVVGASALALCFTDDGLKVRLRLRESALRERAEALRQNPKLAERQPSE